MVMSPWLVTVTAPAVAFPAWPPTVWEAPWSGEYVWPSTDTKVYEYACHEANYSFGGILRGARVLEADAREGR